MLRYVCPPDLMIPLSLELEYPYPIVTNIKDKRLILESLTLKVFAIRKLDADFPFRDHLRMVKDGIITKLRIIFCRLSPTGLDCSQFSELYSAMQWYLSGDQNRHFADLTKEYKNHFSKWDFATPEKVQDWYKTCDLYEEKVHGLFLAAKLDLYMDDCRPDENNAVVALRRVSSPRKPTRPIRRCREWARQHY